MSALHAVLTHDRVMVMTDGAAFDMKTGAVARIERKILSHPTLPIVIASVGLIDHLEIGRAILADSECNASFDDILQNFRGLLAVGETLSERRPDLVSYGEVMIAGFDEKGRARMAAAHFGEVNAALNPPGRVAFTVEEIQIPEHGIAEFSRGPALGASLQAELATLIADNQHLGADMFRQIGAAYFDVMRRAKSANAAYGFTAEFHAVGGHLDFCQLTPAGVSIETLHTWPDQIGEPIRPATK